MEERNIPELHPDPIDNTPSTQEDSLTVKQVDSSLEPSKSEVTVPPPTRDFMYNWIREKSGKK